MKHVIDILKSAVALVLALSLFTIVMPSAVEAAGQLMTIVDSDSASKAQVDTGKLRVGDGEGAMTVDGTLRTVQRGRIPVRYGCLINEFYTTYGDCTLTTVPQGKVLVITQINAEITAESSREITEFWLDTHNEDVAGIVRVAPAQYIYEADGPNYHWSYSLATDVPVAAGKSVIAKLYQDAEGSFVGPVSIQGYLIPA